MRLSKYLEKIPAFFVGANCLGMLLLAGVLVASGYYMLQYYTHHGEAVEVPNVCGKNVKEAIRAIEDAGLSVEVSDTDYVATKQADIILAQSLSPGMTVKPGRMVHLTINAAKPLPKPLPDIADNSSTRQAIALLKAEGFDSVRIEWINGEKDWVYAVKVGGTEVKSGDPVSPGSPIALVVGNGKLKEKFEVTDATDETAEYVTDTILESEIGSLGPGDIVLDNPEILVEEPIEEEGK